MSLENVPGRRYRILAFDGGPFAGAAVRMLRKLVDYEPRLLLRTDLFAGTSFGSFIALWLASRTEEELADGPGTLDTLIPLTDEFYTQYSLPGVGKGTVTSLLRMVAGIGALGNVDRLTAFLERPDVFGGRKLKDLKRHVACVSFDLRAGHYAQTPFEPGQEDPYPRSWGARVFHNLAPDPDHEDWKTGDFERYTWGDWSDRELHLSEVMRRSGALPLWLPIQAGFVDGAVFANNPTMAAVAQVLGFRRWLHGMEATNGFGRIHLQRPDNVVVLSVGGEDSLFVPEKENLRFHETALPGRDLPDRLLDWGWIPWLLKFGAPLLLIEMLLNADGRGVAFQANQILTHGFHLRLTACGLESTGKTLMQATFKPSLVSEKAEEVINDWAKLYHSHSARPGEKPLTDERLRSAAADVMKVLKAIADMIRVDEPGELQHPTPQRLIFYQGVKELDRIAEGITQGSGPVHKRVEEAMPQFKALMSHLPGGDEMRVRAAELMAFLADQERVKPDERAGSVSLPFARAWLGSVWMAADGDDLAPELRNILSHPPLHLWEMVGDPYYRQHVLLRLTRELADQGEAEAIGAFDDLVNVTTL